MILGIIQARLLGPSELGRFQLFITTQTVLIGICALGLGQAGIYFRNTNKIGLERIVTTIFKAEFFLMIGIAVVMFLIILLSVSYFGSVSLDIIIWFSIGTAALLLVSAVRPLFIADMRVAESQIVQYVIAVCTFLFTILIYRYRNSLSVEEILIIVSISNILGMLTLIYSFRKEFKYHLKFEFPLFKDITKFGLKMSFNNIAYLFLQYAPIYMLTWFSLKGFYDVGLFSRAVSVCAIAAFVNSTIGPLLYSKLSSIKNDQKVEYGRLISSSFLIINILVTLLIIIFARILILLLFGEDYVGAVPILRILALTLVFNGIGEIINNLFASIGKPEFMLYNFLITLAVLIPLLYFFIAQWGLIGCAIAVLLATIIKAFLLINSLKKFVDLGYKDYFYLKIENLRKLRQIIVR